MKRHLKRAASAILSALPAPKHPLLEGAGLHLRWRMGWLKGRCFLLCQLWKSRLGGTRLEVGDRFSLQGRLVLKGPGTVKLGNDVIVDAKTDIYTHSPEAVVTVGDRSFLNGMRVGCSQAIRIGDDAIIADVRIMDTDFHSVSKRRQSRDAPIVTSPVTIGRNVWIAGGAAVLKGTEIGDNSVVAFGSVVVKSLPADCIAGGNPAKEIGKVPE